MLYTAVPLLHYAQTTHKIVLLGFIDHDQNIRTFLWTLMSCEFILHLYWVCILLIAAYQMSWKHLVCSSCAQNICQNLWVRHRKLTDSMVNKSLSSPACTKPHNSGKHLWKIIGKMIQAGFSCYTYNQQSFSRQFQYICNWLKIKLQL